MHGAGEGPGVWEGWPGEAVDLQAGLSVAEASMLNYEAAIACDAALLPRPLCVVGRGLGALAAMMAARRVEPERLVLLDPWAPAEVGGAADAAVAASSRPESPRAVAECRRGISVPSLPGRTLVVGSDAVAAFYGAEAAGKKTPAEIIQWA